MLNITRPSGARRKAAASSLSAWSPLLELHEGWLRVHFDRETHGDFHYRWLRHNCDRERHPLTGERTLCSSELPDIVRPRQATIREGRLEVEWEHGGHASAFELDWLRAHAYALGRTAAPAPPSDPATVEVKRRGLSLEREVALALRAVRAHGLAVVRRVSADRPAPEAETEALIEALQSRSLRVIGTHFGRVEDLRTDNTTNANTDQLGYTDAPVHLHTDQPFLDHPPRYQLLQCVRVADEGGENLVADALAAWRYLASLDARAAELLRTVPVRFLRKQRHFERIVDAPLVTVEGERFQVRMSYFTLAPHRLPFESLDEFYRAHDRFVRLVRDPRHHYRVALQPGDWLLYDNHRMLHARAGFRGPRWMRGVYFDAASAGDEGAP